MEIFFKLSNVKIDYNLLRNIKEFGILKSVTGYM